MKKLTLSIILLIICLAFFGCAENGRSFIKTQVTLGADQTETDLSLVEEGTELVLRTGGSYLFTGKGENVRILIDGGDGDFTLVLDGASLSYDGGEAVISCVKAGSVGLVLNENTENFISDGSDNAEGGAIYVKSADLTVSGEGSLEIESSSDGIFNTKNLTVKSGNIVIRSQDRGLTAKKSVNIEGGSVVIDSVSDGIKAKGETNEADETIEGTGTVSVSGGSVEIKSESDGIQSNGNIEITGGEIKITTTGTETGSDEENGAGIFAGFKRGFGQNESLPSVTSKGIQAEGSISISKGRISVESTGHSVSAKGDVTVSGEAEMTLSAYCEGTNGKGIKAEGALRIEGGKIRITRSYEGLESKDSVYITGGDIELVASDDGVQAENLISVSGGYVYADADGDGFDSNGDIEIKGGTVIISGPETDADGALDSGDGNHHISVTGGILVASGSIGMAEYPSAETTTQNCLCFSVSGKSGDTFGIADESGENILALKLTKTVQSLCVSSPDIKTGKSYSIFSGVTPSGDERNGVYSSFDGGSTVQTVTVSSTVSPENAGGFDGRGGPGGFDPRGGDKGDFDPKERENMPEPPGGGDMPEPPGGGDKPEPPGGGDMPEPPGGGNMQEPPQKP